MHRHPTVHDCRWGPSLVARVENAVLESYRVVRLLPRIIEGGEYLRVSVYTSETLRWEEFVFPCEIPARDIRSAFPATLGDRILHWLTKHGSIVAYDPYANPSHVRFIAPPPVMLLSAPDSSRVVWGASGGKLRYLEHLHGGGMFSDGRFRLWVLEDYDSGTWRLSHESDVPAELATDVGPMFFDPFDPDILYMAGARRLATYDFKAGKVEEQHAYGC